MSEIFRRIARDEGRQDDYGKMAILGQTLQWSNCVHGSASPTIMLRSAEFFREEIDEHINNHRCPAQVCRGLVRYEISGESERLPDAAAICPTEAIVQSDDAWSIDQARCIKCNACRDVAPDAVRVVDIAAEPVPAAAT